VLLCLVKVNGKENKSLIVGTRMLRKTAFLLPIKSNCNVSKRNRYSLDELDEASILLDARHKDIVIMGTKTYLGDSATLKALLRRSGMDEDPLQRVGKYNLI
jgi:hypothetical protein